MRLTSEYLSKAFQDITKRDFCFNEALNIVKQNCHGRIWLIGGYLYKNLVRFLYPECEAKAKDLDFLVEGKEMNYNMVIPNGWRIETSKFGCTRLIGNSKIDIIDIEEFYPISAYGVSPTINNFLIYSPLNIQSIAYDVFEKKVLGDIGIHALEKKIIAVNNSEMVSDYSKILNYVSFLKLKEEADELGFKAELV